MRWVVATFGLLAAIAPAAAQDKSPPYWASIASGEAMTRAGPGRTYPGLWLYKRRDLPVRVLKIYENWRLIEDPDGDKGWMLVSLMSAQRTGVVRPGAPRAIHEKRTTASRIAYRAEPGVAGKLDLCDGDWCRIAVGKRSGWIRQVDLDGVAAGEAFGD
ncbi:SH3 domain-containing protein [Sphingomonas mesophila]|uniref:SH3 domain-containing protein n=1 Tax=Sphingomonas mesophila TaxID=2303576 RepID=UPI000E573DFD|nr:SH3 domain-containing protein [Sphingomonas mesophila]